MRTLAQQPELMPAEDDASLVIMPVPALVAVLTHAEDRKESPLAESEVLVIRDGAACVALLRLLCCRPLVRAVSR